MINFSEISRKSLVGKYLRGILKIIPKNSVLPICQGKLKGKKWIIGSGVFGYWLGSYEFKKQKIFENKLKKGDVVYDIGAHAGFYTLLAAELVGKKGQIFSFEPNPKNIFFLQEHVAINNYKNVKVFEEAVSDKTGSQSFDFGVNSSYGKFSDSGESKVQTVVLDDLCGSGELPLPNVVKIDVEGAELAVLKGSKIMLEKSHPLLFLSAHSQELYRSCLNFLAPLGYNFYVIDENEAKTDIEVLAYPK